MKFADLLKQIAEQELAVKPAGTPVHDPVASGSAPGDKAGARTLDDGQTLDNQEGTKVADGSESGSAPGDKAGARPADNSDSLEVKKSGTDPKDPVAHVISGRGTEVQGNKIYEEIESELDEIVEAWFDGASKRTPEENKAALKASLKKSLDKATDKHKEKKDDMEEACAAGKKKMQEAIEKSLNEGVEFEVQLSEEISPLLAKAELTEEFAQTAIELIEAAVTSITRDHLHKVNAYAAEVVAEAYDNAVSALEESVESYLAEEVAEWKEENKLAIESSFKVRVAESFMEGLKDLLEAHYVEVPEDKEDLYESALTAGQQTLDELNSEKERAAVLESEITELKKKLFVESYISSADLTDVQSDKIRSLSESLEFTDVEKMTAKLDALKESVVVKKSSAVTELVLEDATPVEDQELKVVVESEIERLASQLSKFSKKV